MKVDSLHLNNQRNAAHYQFQTDFNQAVIRFTPQALCIVEAFEAFQLLYQDEGVALVSISKSAATDQLGNADHYRDGTFRGMSDTVSSKLNHFSAAIRDAAKRVMVILDGYGNLAPKPNDEESGLISGLIADLRTKLPADVTLLGIEDWIAELERQNNVFVALQASRNSEEASRTELRMKQVRIEVDAAYRKIVERINALIVVNGEAPYTEFVKEINVRIARANDAIAQSKGRSASKPAPEE